MYKTLILLSIYDIKIVREPAERRPEVLMFFWLLDGLTTYMTTSLPTAIEQEKQDEEAYQFYILAVMEHEETLCELDDPHPDEIQEYLKVMSAHYACDAVRGKWYLDWLYVPRRRRAIKLARAFITKYMPIPAEPKA